MRDGMIDPKLEKEARNALDTCWLDLGILNVE